MDRRRGRMTTCHGINSCTVSRSTFAVCNSEVPTRDLHHRDIKPENVLFDGSEVKLCDFGLTATWQRDPVTNERLRFPQCVSGTMGFFAPEMLATTGYDGPAADVWSLGVVPWGNQDFTAPSC